MGVRLAAAPSQPHALGLRGTTIAVAVFGAMAFYLWRVMGLFTRFPGTNVDARFNQAVLEHQWLWATGRADSLGDPAFFYPYKSILFLSESYFGSGWIYGIGRALGASRETSFDLWYLAGMATTFAATVFTLRRFGLPTVSALFGACAFTFALPMLAQDAHAQFVYRFATPLATLACVEFLRGPSLRRLAILALWVAWQFLCCVYLGLFVVEFLAFFGAIAALAPNLRSRVGIAPGVLGAGLAWAAAPVTALAAYVVWRYADLSRMFAVRRPMFQIEGMAPHWTSFLSQQGAPSDLWLSNLLPQHTKYWSLEHQLFPGFGVLLLAGVGVWSAFRRGNDRPVALACLVSIVGTLALSIDIDGFGVYRWLAEAPGLNAIRSPGRIMLVTAFPIAWLAALGVTWLRRSGAPAASALLTLGLALSLGDITAYRSMSVDVAEAQARVRAMTAGLDGKALRARRAVLWRFGNGETWEETRLDIDLMLAAQDLGVSTSNGYSGSDPPGYVRPRDCAETRAAIAGADALPYKRAGAENVAARAVIVPPGACGSQ